MAKSIKNRDKQNANLVQNRPDYPREKIVECARKAAAVSASNRRKRKSLKEAAEVILSAAIGNEEIRNLTVEVVGNQLEKQGLTWAEAVIAATVLQAVNGNVSAVRELREIMGNTETEQNADVPVIVFEERGGTDES